jgi:hypothetical protein
LDGLATHETLTPPELAPPSPSPSCISNKANLPSNPLLTCCTPAISAPTVLLASLTSTSSTAVAFLSIEQFDALIYLVKISLKLGICRSL